LILVKYSILLGLIQNKTLDYLTEFLKTDHILENISFGEDTSDPWTEKSKYNFH